MNRVTVLSHNLKQFTPQLEIALQKYFKIICSSRKDVHELVHQIGREFEGHTTVTSTNPIPKTKSIIRIQPKLLHKLHLTSSYMSR